MGSRGRRGGSVRNGTEMVCGRFWVTRGMAWFPVILAGGGGIRYRASIGRSSRRGNCLSCFVQFGEGGEKSNPAAVDENLEL